MGLLEMTSKGTYGMGLICLGREAISGSTLRRVRAPGALADDSTEVGLLWLLFWTADRDQQRGSEITQLCCMLQAIEDARDPEVRARHQRLLASWQAALPSLFPSIKVRLGFIRG